MVQIHGDRFSSMFSKALAGLDQELTSWPRGSASINAFREDCQDCQQSIGKDESIKTGGKTRAPGAPSISTDA